MGLSSDYKCLLDLQSSRAALLASVNEVASLNAWEAFQVLAGVGRLRRESATSIGLHLRNRSKTSSQCE